MVSKENIALWAYYMELDGWVKSASAIPVRAEKMCAWDGELNLEPWISKTVTLPLSYIPSPTLPFPFCFEIWLSFPSWPWTFDLPASASKMRSWGVLSDSALREPTDRDLVLVVSRHCSNAWLGKIYHLILKLSGWLAPSPNRSAVVKLSLPMDREA